MIKMQHLAIIFIIIIVPISIVISQYTQTQIDTIYLQSQYNSKLQDACYDAIKAFQINTINNKYSSLNDSRLRDIEASVTTFYNSIGTSMGASGYNKTSLQSYIPAMVYTMYDGYYIYGRYYDNTDDTQGYGLKPFIPYSCRYNTAADGADLNTADYDFVVNYTLDNYIYIYGKINGDYETKSGYLISNFGSVSVSDEIRTSEDVLIGYRQATYDGIPIEPEILTEQLITINDSISTTSEEFGNRNSYEYVIYKNQKIYYDGTEYFTCRNGRKTIMNDSYDEIVATTEITPIKYAKALTWPGTDGINHLHSISAIDYYKEAADFSEWVYNNLGDHITAKNVIDLETGGRISDNYFSTNTGDEKIFQFDDDTNNPLISASTFNEHRMNVIRKSIETNLKTAIASYNIGRSGNYDFIMPNISEVDWQKLLNNISLSVFMQGLPMKSKYYNSYCVVTNDKNKEVATEDSIYIIESEDSKIAYGEGQSTAHLPGCEELFKRIATGSNSIHGGNSAVYSGAYNTKDFMMQTATLSEGIERYFYPHFAQKCYSCIVNASSKVYDVDNIISGKLEEYDVESEGFVERDSHNYETDLVGTLGVIRKAYLTALGRERYDLYKLNGNIN